MVKNWLQELLLLFSLLSVSIVCGNSFNFSKFKIATNDSIHPKKSKLLVEKLANVAPILTATGNQIFCQGTPLEIVTDFDILDPDDIGIEAIYVQISSGYNNGQDLLSLSGLHPNITSTWNTTTGKLTLAGVSSQPTYIELIAAVKDVVFSTLTPNPAGVKSFSITVGQANYLPSNGHYYQYIPNIGVTWTSAKTLAENSTYYGLQGYLATITSAPESQLAGEQATGAGWIGGSDQATEGIWIWVTGPENGTIFWNGGVNGSTPNFAFWNSGEPNNLNNENYAHITAPGVGITGSWNDISNTGESSGNYQPKGFIVEYGGMPGDPILQISASTTISIPSINPVVPISSCDSGVFELIATSNNGNVHWYENQVGGTPIAIGNMYTTPLITTTTTYYLDPYLINCSTSTRIPFTITIIDFPIVSVITPSSVCERSSTTIIASSTSGIVNWFTSLTDTNPIAVGNSFTTPILTQDTTYFLEANNNGCISTTRISVTVTLNSIPIVTDEEIIICEGETTLLDAGISDMTYIWSNGETSQTINTTTGVISYSVLVTSPENCSKTKNITINENTIPVITEINIEGSTATIITSGFGDFEYSIDGINYQTSNLFTIVEGGLYRAYVRETNFCGEDNEPFIIISFPEFFTPNNDGYNDFWRIKGMEYYPNAVVKIFDRYGKFITQLNSNNPSWDGTLNDKNLPSTDYWFSFKNNAFGIENSGHFSLKR